MVYKCNRQSLKGDPPFKFWQGTKQNKVIPTKVAISIDLANELAKHYYDLDQAKTALEAEQEKLHTQAEGLRMILRKVKAEGPVTSVKLRNTVRGLGGNGEVVEIEEVWVWKNEVTSPGEDLEPQKSDLVYLESWSPDIYRPQDLSRQRTLTPSEAEVINKVLAQEGMSEKQLEAQIRQITTKAGHVGTQIAAIDEQLDLPLTLKSEPGEPRARKQPMISSENLNRSGTKEGGNPPKEHDLGSV